MTVALGNEADVIERAKQGNADAFEVLYHLHKRRVYSLCLHMTSDMAAAEDLTQEAFLQLFRRIGSFRGESALSTWLHRVAVNLVLMRRRKKLATVSLEESLDTEQASPDEEIGTHDLRLSGSIDRLQLERAINELPLGYRTAFVLHDVEGYEHHEIAGITGRTVGNSKSQLHKARMSLRKLLRMSKVEASISS